MSHRSARPPKTNAAQAAAADAAPTAARGGGSARMSAAVRLPDAGANSIERPSARGRQAQVHGRPMFRARLQLDHSAVSLDDLPADGEAEAGALACRLGREATLK